MATGYLLPPPMGLKLKLSRARRHLRHVARVLEGFTEGNPASWRRDVDVKGEYYSYSLQVRYASDSVELLVDEAAYHLRSVLDHLVAGIVESLGETVTKDHGFPILREMPDTEERKARVRKMLKHVPIETQGFIDSVQPYHEGKEANRHPLAILSRLNNGFKHRSLHLLAFQLQCPSVPGVVQPPAPRWGRSSGDVFAMVPLTVDVEKDFEPGISVQIGFRRQALGIPNVGIATINNVFNYVRSEVVLKLVRMNNPPNRL